jgi:translin
MPSLKNVLKEIKTELEEKEESYEQAQNKMRKVLQQSKQAILQIHQRKVEEARKLISTAKEAIQKLNEELKLDPETIYSGLLSAARQEYAEASIFQRLVEKSEFVTPEEVGVPSVDYVLGLADVIGEYRRLVLDLLREGDLTKSEACLKTMDEIYIELTGLDEAYMLVPGLRRKCDIARKIIEITRGDVTQEIRREVLTKRLERFEKSMKKK